jgi:cytochrome P450
MGLPIEDRHLLLPYANQIVRASEPSKIHEARVGLKDYAEAMVADRRAHPKDDLITKLTSGRVDGEPVPNDKLVGMLALALSGGLDTVKNLMGFSCLGLAKRPDLQRRLREDPSIIPVAVEELCRRNGVSNTARLVTSDAVLSGVQLKEGDQIQQFSYLVGLSDATVPHPLELDFDRPMPIPHATFGNGPHRCPGSILAKRELIVWLEEWFPRIGEFRVKDGTVPQQRSASVQNMTELWLTWDTV